MVISTTSWAATRVSVHKEADKRQSTAAVANKAMTR